MTPEQNNLPPLPSGEEMERRARENRFNEVRPFFLDARENYPEPFYMLEYKGVPFSAIGGIQALSGQKKNGKTFVLAQLMAAILCTGGERVEQYLPHLRVPQRTLDMLGHEPTVLYVDTEMEKLNSAKVLRRVHWLCGWPMDVPNERFNVLWLRSIVDVKDDEGKLKERAYERRYRLIRLAIEMLHPDAVFIDGIRDIIGDFNDNEESSRLIGDLMALAERNHICIWNTLHMNPRPGNDDESKMRGHLGTELGNKITDTLVSIKKKDGSGVTFTVKQNDARGKDLDDWTFMVTDDAGSLGIPRMLLSGPPEEKKDGDDPEDIRRWIMEGTKLLEWPLSKRQVKELVFCQIGGQKSHTKQTVDLTIALNMKLLVQSAQKSPGGEWKLEPPADPF